MALALKDRVQQQGTANTTVSFTLTASVAGFQSFAAVGDGNTTYYTATDIGGNWEVGIGTYSSTGPTITRDTILSSSNSGSAVTFSGTVNIWVDYPAGKSVNLNADGVAEIGQPIGYSDTGLIATFASTEAGYNQIVVQNKSSATNASANINISNDTSTSTSGFAELGINSSTFTGSGAFNIPSAAYLASAGTDLSIGTYSAHDIHFVTNSSTTDAMTIFDNGGTSLGAYGNPGIGNLAVNKIVSGVTTITSSAGTTVLDAASTYYQVVVGTTTQTIQLPDATTLLNGTTFIIDNDSTGNVTVTDNASASLDIIPAGGISYLYLSNNSTVAGSWTAHGFLPSIYNFNNSTADFANATITNAVWNGTTIASGYGGTGLTTFVGANNALYSTGASTLTAGTLPVAAGGTGLTSLTADYIPYGNGTSAYQSSSTFTFNGTTFSAPSASLSGNLTFTGTGSRIIGGFAGTSNDSTLIQHRGTNQDTIVGIIPSGTSVTSSVRAFNNSNVTNSAFFGLSVNSANEARLASGILGTGTYLPMTFHTGGSERMRIDTSGNVGVGTTTTGSRLRTTQSSTTAYSFIAQTPTVGLTAGDYVNMAYFANSREANNDGLRIVNLRDSTGSGIGNWETESYRIRRSVDANDGSSGVQEEIIFGNNTLGFSAGGQERIRITSTGDVGIGTTNPSGRLEVLGGVANTIADAGTGDAATLTITNSNVSSLGRIAKTLYEIGNLPLASVSGVYTDFNGTNDIGGALAFSTQTNVAGGVVERMRITSNGGISFGSSGTAYGTSGQVLQSNGDAPPTWVTPSSGGGYAVSVIGTNTTAVKGTLYVLTASLTLTLPASPTAGDQVAISNLSGTTTAVIGRNGEKIMNLSEDMTVDVISAGITLVYSGATYGWVTI